MNTEFSFAEHRVGTVRIPNTAPIATLTIVHGMAETIERYDAFATAMSERGVVVFGYNQSGHGPTAKPLGYLGPRGFQGLVDDLGAVLSVARSTYPELPAFVIGHSMGSFVVRRFLEEHEHALSGAILSGTGDVPRISLIAGASIAKHHCKRHGDKDVSMLIHNMAFGPYNRLFPDEPVNAWLSRDASIVQAYNDDPLCGRPHPASYYLEFFQSLRRLKRPIRRSADRLPLLFVSGDRDPLGGKQGSLVKKVLGRYREAGYRTDLLLYRGGRHEMLNETNREEVYRDLASWLDEVIHGE